MATDIRHQRPWVLLRGLGRESRHWGRFTIDLTAALGGAAVLTPDLAGNGQRWLEPSATTIQGQCDGVRQELQGMLAQGPVNVLAISLGGMVALDWASRFPSEINRLVLINTSLAGLAPFWQRLRWQNYGALCRLPLLSLKQRERQILRLTSNHGSRRRDALPDWIQWQQTRPVRSINLLRQLIAAARYQPPRTWPACKALVIHSANDRLVHPACSQALAAASHWPILQHPTAGHDLPLDEPQWLAAQIATWCGTASHP